MMSKRTAWLLILFLGAASSLFFFGRGRVLPSPNFLAQVGMVVGIAPNPYNTLNDQLQAEKTQLDQQAADLAARQAAFESSTGVAATVAQTSPVVWYLSMAVALIGILVCLNFYFDWRRSRRAPEEHL
jgi:preprotein translocase subunit SecF